MIDLHEENVYNKSKDDILFQKTAKLRLDFFDKSILNVNTESYSTQTERDWAYIALREYRYKVHFPAVFHSLFIGNVALIISTFLRRKFTPSAMIVSLPFYFYFKDVNRIKHNKRFFDMCNIGEQFELGKQRNIVLRECNRILDVEDF